MVWISLIVKSKINFCISFPVILPNVIQWFIFLDFSWSHLFESEECKWCYLCQINKTGDIAIWKIEAPFISRFVTFKN